jgi:hypothetical protein
MLMASEPACEMRMRALLDRQAAAARRDREAELARSAAAAKALDSRRDVERLWDERSITLDRAIAALNRRMAANGVRLYRRWSDTWGLERSVDKVEIGFTERMTYRTDPRFLMFHIGLDRRVYARIGNASSSLAKEGSFRLDEAHEGRWTLWLLDFLDLNTPADND